MKADEMAEARRAISIGIVAIHREHFGRGSNSVRTIIQGDYVASFLDDIFTPGERTLIHRMFTYEEVTDDFAFLERLWQSGAAIAGFDGVSRVKPSGPAGSSTSMTPPPTTCAVRRCSLRSPTTSS